jgi:hypothetical protein
MEDVRRLPVGEDSEIAVSLDELAREGARRMIATALKAEADEYVERFADERGDDGKRLVVRNGRARERSVTVGSGTVAIQAPRVNDRRVDEETGERQKFSSRILPAYRLLDAAQERWRRFNGHELVSDVLAGVKFKDGIQVTDDETTTADERVAA